MSLLLSSAERISGCCRREPSAPYVCGAASQVSRRVCTDSVEFCTGFHATVRIHHPGAAFFLNPQFSHSCCRLTQNRQAPCKRQCMMRPTVQSLCISCTLFLHVPSYRISVLPIKREKELPLRLHSFILLAYFTLGRLALLHEVRNTTL